MAGGNNESCVAVYGVLRLARGVQRRWLVAMLEPTPAVLQPGGGDTPSCKGPRRWDGLFFIRPGRAASSLRVGAASGNEWLRPEVQCCFEVAGMEAWSYEDTRGVRGGVLFSFFPRAWPHIV